MDGGGRPTWRRCLGRVRDPLGPSTPFIAHAAPFAGSGGLRAGKVAGSHGGQLDSNLPSGVAHGGVDVEYEFERESLMRCSYVRGSTRSVKRSASDVTEWPLVASRLEGRHGDAFRSLVQGIDLSCTRPDLLQMAEERDQDVQGLAQQCDRLAHATDHSTWLGQISSRWSGGFS